MKKEILEALECSMAKIDNPYPINKVYYLVSFIKLCQRQLSALNTFCSTIINRIVCEVVRLKIEKAGLICISKPQQK